MAEYVTVRNNAGEERQVPKSAAPFFTNQGFVVLDAAGRKKATQPAPAIDNSKGN